MTYKRRSEMKRSFVQESIFSGKTTVIPMADVQHIEKHPNGGCKVITKHTRWDMEADTWANNIWLDTEEAVEFKKAWCLYRGELEGLVKATP